MFRGILAEDEDVVNIHPQENSEVISKNIIDDALECRWCIAEAEGNNQFELPKLRVEGSFFNIFVVDSNLVEPTDKVDFGKDRRVPQAWSIWVPFKVKGIHLERFGRSKLGTVRTYATYHSLFSLAGNPLCMGLRWVEFFQIDAACPVDVEVHPIGSGPFYKGVPTEACLGCRGVFEGLFQVNAEALLRTWLVPGRREPPICLFK